MKCNGGKNNLKERKKEWKWANTWWVRFDWIDESLKFDVHKGYSMLHFVQFTWEKNHSSYENLRAEKSEEKWLRSFWTNFSIENWFFNYSMLLLKCHWSGKNWFGWIEWYKWTELFINGCIFHENNFDK